MITASVSPLMMAQKAHVAGISREHIAPVPGISSTGTGRRSRRAELEPDAGAGPFAQESPALRNLVDQQEAASALVLAARFAPVREPGPVVIDDVHVYDRAAAHHRDGHPGGADRMLHGVRDEFARKQLGLHAGRVAGQKVPNEPAGNRYFFGAPGEGARR